MASEGRGLGVAVLVCAAVAVALGVPVRVSTGGVEVAVAVLVGSLVGIPLLPGPAVTVALGARAGARSVAVGARAMGEGAEMQPASSSAKATLITDAPVRPESATRQSFSGVCTGYTQDGGCSNAVGPARRRPHDSHGRSTSSESRACIAPSARSGRFPGGAGHLARKSGNPAPRGTGDACALAGPVPLASTGPGSSRTDEDTSRGAGSCPGCGRGR